MPALFHQAGVDSHRGALVTCVGVCGVGVVVFAPYANQLVIKSKTADHQQRVEDNPLSLLGLLLPPLRLLCYYNYNPIIPRTPIPWRGTQTHAWNRGVGLRAS